MQGIKILSEKKECLYTLNLNHSLWLLNMYYHLIIGHIDLFPTIRQGLKQLYKDKMYLQSKKVLFPFVKFRTELI